MAEGGLASLRAPYAPDLFLRAALTFLDRHKAGAPLYLMVTSTLPRANNELGKRDGNGMEIPGDAPYSAEPWPPAMCNHAAMITRLEGDVGAILARLAELGLADDTLVLFSSDNGPH